MLSALNIHEHKLLDKDRRLEHELVVVKSEKEHHETRDVKSKKAITNTKFELAKANEALHVL